MDTEKKDNPKRDNPQSENLQSENPQSENPQRENPEKEYELRTCGYNSTKTHILEVIYDDLFEKSKEVSIHFDATDVIPEYLIKDSSMMEFARAVILMVVAICAVYVLLMVLNRPPYPVPSK